MKRKAIDLYLLRHCAAEILLDQWGKQCAYVAFAREEGRHVPRLEPHPVMPDGAAWPTDSEAAEELLVATVIAGAEYRGWDEALRQAAIEETSAEVMVS